MLSESDKRQIIEHGSTIESVENQIRNFKSGFSFLILDSAATTEHGIRKISQLDQVNLLRSFDSLKADKTLVKFVPASGAASRMFKSLFSFIDEYSGTDEDYRRFSNGESFPDVYQFFREIKNFAFYDDLKAVYDIAGEGLQEAHLKHRFVNILKALLTDSGLDYSQLPKGLLKFHRYKTGSRTPAEEHLVEGANYARYSQGNVRINFTVSPEHQSKFESYINRVKSIYEHEFSVTFQVTYSEQKHSTDTIAVDLHNNPFRNEDGTILFRPAGHGALIANLNDIEGDIVFIKNIDNVIPDYLKGTTYTYKKVLAAILMETQEACFNFLEQIDTNWSPQLEEQIVSSFEELNIVLPDDYVNKNESSRREFLHSKLNRPIRVCGMVGNIGDTGGGPFWIKAADGTLSIQIVETAQLDLSNKEQQTVFQSSTHFNPVDLVCSSKSYNGTRFDLTKYTDPKAGFITEKSKDGKALKVQELPGLWNGSMANWISIFVEVPKLTFNPVKTVTDLLNDQHQPPKDSLYE